MTFPLITKENFFIHSSEVIKPWQQDYLAMYSSQWPGITKDPDLMVVPVDDHLVHRGDGVFDVMRCVRGKIYMMEEHLERLERSSRAILLDFPSEYENIRELIKELVLAGGEKERLIRIVISRGPGSFSVNPFDCPSSQIYANVIRYRSLNPEWYRDGVSIMTNRVPTKKSFFANIKSCNYLPNVLMKMEAVRAGAHYSVALDEDGFLAEGSTENVGVITSDGVLKFPTFERTLSGITAKRVFQLATELVKERVIKDVRFVDIPVEEAYNADEMFMTGTSVEILPVVRYDGRQIGPGRPGLVYWKLSGLIRKDMTENPLVLTEIEGW